MIKNVDWTFSLAKETVWEIYTYLLTELGPEQRQRAADKNGKQSRKRQSDACDDGGRRKMKEMFKHINCWTTNCLKHLHGLVFHHSLPSFPLPHRSISCSSVSPKLNMCRLMEPQQTWLSLKEPSTVAERSKNN